jgi:hypothetical protein
MYINLDYQIQEHLLYNRGVMVNVFASSVVDREFAPRAGPTKD